MASIEGLYAGRVESLELGGEPSVTAIRKRPVTTAQVGALGVEGDEQADRNSHGGPDMALCVYPAEHYPMWERRFGRPLQVPAFGENLRVAGRLEDDVALGEVWLVGEVRLQVAQPRVPCRMPATLNGEPRLTSWMCQSGATGYLLRVLQGGTIAVGAAVEVVERPASLLTVAELNRLRYVDTDDGPGLRRALAADTLTATWRARLENQLARVAG